jgi:hypothetical protein
MRQSIKFDKCANGGGGERAIHKDDLGGLIDDAALQRVFAGYLYPATEIQDEGKKLRDGFSKKLASSNPMEARSALYALFAERVAWEDDIDEFEKRMRLKLSVPTGSRPKPESRRPP